MARAAAEAIQNRVSISFFLFVFGCCLGQFTRNYTQTTKRGLLTTKQAEYQAPGKCKIFSLFCCAGFPKGHPLAHDFACKV